MNRSFIYLLICALSLLSVSCRKDPTPGTGPGGGEDTIPVSSFVKVVASPKGWDSDKRAGITYQLLVYSFADNDNDGWGDFRGITDKLDYIDDLGASAIWLSPVHPSASYHGYDVTDFSLVNERYGTMDDFRNLVEEAHKRNIRIYLDYVINHTGTGHRWFQSAITGEKSPYRDFYIFSQTPQADISSGKIPMIATEGAGGYDSGQWFSVSNTTAVRYRFTLNWSNPAYPTVTVAPAEEIDPDNPDTSTQGAKYLYYGDGIMKKFYSAGNNIYTLSLDFSSSWGFLIRTSNDPSWPQGTKYGAGSQAGSTITPGVPFTLYTNTSGNENVYDIQMPGATKYHSHFWTSWFADLNYGAVDTAERSGAFRAVVDDARVWIDAGIDGFRLDAVKHIYHNASSSENPQFLKKFYNAVNAYYRQNHSNDLYMVGEVYSEYDQVAPYYAGLPALFEFSFWNRLKWALQNNTGCYIASDLNSYPVHYAQYREDYIIATKLSNHDEVRTRTELGNSLQKAVQAGAVLLTARGNPYIYYGEELGYTGNKTNGDIYVRSPMLWGDGYTTTYTTDVDPSLSANVGTVVTQQADTTSILRVYRKFTRARNTYPALAYGTMTKHGVYNQTSSDTYPSLAAWYRTYGSEKLLVLHNLGNSSLTFPVTDQIKNAVVCHGNVYVKTESAQCTVKMDAYSSVVFEIQ